MKRLTLATFMFALTFCTYAQDAVIPASGSATIGSFSVDWSLGDVIAGSYENPTVVVGNGVAAATTIFTVSGDIPASEDKTPNVYPVPFVNEFFIAQKEQSGLLEYKLFDTSGREVSVSHSQEGPLYRIQASDVSSGAYILVIKQEHSAAPHVFKLIKK